MDKIKKSPISGKLFFISILRTTYRTVTPFWTYLTPFSETHNAMQDDKFYCRLCITDCLIMYQNCCHSQNTTIDLEFIGLPLPIRPVCHDISVSSPLLSFSSRRSRCLGPLRNPPTTVLSHAAITRHYWSSHQDPRGTWIGGTYNRNAATLKYRGPIYLHTFALCPGRHRRHVGTEIQGLWWEAA